jgi:tRNA pseudouridine38-40 synthase
MRYRAQVEYDGTGYYGFQRQKKGQPTIQSELERALHHLTTESTVITGAGRTDRGVHATGQVISFDCNWSHGVEALLKAINATLSSEIAVLAVEEATPEFHPRYDAKRRTYQYHVYNGTVRSPIRRLRSWHVRRPLDLDSMNQAAASLVGEQDFATFGNPPQGLNTVRTVYTAHWRRQDRLLIFTIEANAFLYRMVRSLVGSLKAVGEGAWSDEEFVAALHARDRSRASAMAPPYGLYLVGVDY